MRTRLKTRIQQLEAGRVAPESDGKLPLAVIRRCINGSLSPSELMRWHPVIKRIIAEAASPGDRDTTPSGEIC
jgi:hypothetical protein